MCVIRLSGLNRLKVLPRFIVKWTIIFKNVHAQTALEIAQSLHRDVKNAWLRSPLINLMQEGKHAKFVAKLTMLGDIA